MRKYGCIYKSEQGVECLVIRNYFNEVFYSFDLNHPDVLAFASPQKIDKFMTHFYGGEYLSKRSLNGEYRVIELEAFYVLAGWRVKQEVQKENPWLDYGKEEDK